MVEPIPADVTRLLGQWSGGDRAAFDAMIPLVSIERESACHSLGRARAMLAHAWRNDLPLRNEYG